MQACSDRVAWPFPSIAATIARLHPDLVVHVGDYYYRETPCTIPSCAGPSGDNSPAWDADWFGPAAPLFASAPLVLARGNHEDCARGGDGWFRYLDPRPALQCTAVTAPWSMTAGSLRLVVFDSASADDLRLDPALDVAYRTQFSAARALAGSAGGTTWFVTHRPVYTNANERVTMGDALAPFDAILAGHIHTFAAIDLSALPPLIVNGEGGDLLDSDADSGAILSVAVSDLRPTAPPLVRSAFGFAVYTRTAAGWDVSLRAVDGSERLRCALAKRHVRCSDVPHPAST